MGGGLMQLVAYGAQDIYLTGNPQITFFKIVYRRYTNFSMETIRQYFDGTVGANQRVVAKISRNGDLIYDCFLKIPSHQAAAHTGYNYGHNILDYVEVEIGGQLIDKHYGHWMEVYSELTEKNEVGHHADNPHDDNQGGVTGSNYGHPTKFQLMSYAGGSKFTETGKVLTSIYVPLRFWFCRHVGLALPLIALQYHEVNININLTADAVNLTNGLQLWCNYIYLDTDERRRFAQVSHEYLIEQVQLQTFSGNPSGGAFELNFNHPVKELIWVGEKTGGEWGQSYGSSAISGKTWKIGGLACTETWQLKLNGIDRFEKQTLDYFTRYQIYKYHTGFGGITERDSIAVYSFSLEPEEHQPSGTCNFSRIDNAQLIYDGLHEDANNIYVYAVNYNVLRIMSGMGGLTYSN